jgi:glutamate synthase (NADPH/NADH) small chain
MRRGQSLVVWAIREGRDCAAAVDAFLAAEREQETVMARSA